MSCARWRCDRKYIFERQSGSLKVSSGAFFVITERLLTLLNLEGLAKLSYQNIFSNRVALGSFLLTFLIINCIIIYSILIYICEALQQKYPLMINIFID